LLHAGLKPIIIDNFVNSNRSVLDGLRQILGQDVTCYAGDCNDPGLLTEIFEKEQIQGVIHFAAYKAVGESVAEPMKYYRNNLDSTMLLLETMQRYGVKNLVFSSSCTVYGQPEQLPVTEETPRLPAQSPYGNTKAICEDILRDVSHAGAPLRIMALRYFNPIGAHESGLIGELPIGVPGNLVPYITQTAAGLRQQLTVFGGDYNTPDGTCIRDFIHVVDLAKAHVQALQYLEKEAQEPYYDIFNLGTGRGNKVLEVIQTFEEVNDIKVNYTIGPRRAGDIEQIYAVVDKAANVLGWRTEKTLAESLRDAWRWQQNLGKQ